VQNPRPTWHAGPIILVQEQPQGEKSTMYDVDLVVWKMVLSSDSGEFVKLWKE